MKTLAFVFLAVFLTSNAVAQKNTVSSGGTATGSGGSSTYTIGQIDYTTFKDSNTLVCQGIQQPYEIFPVNIKPLIKLQLLAVAYPNPTINTITLRIDEKIKPGLFYSVCDMTGKILLSGSVTSINTKINIETFAAGTYMLNVSLDGSDLQTFKIIKNL